MSRVISFRLNPINPREAQALKILQSKHSEGFSSRRVLTDALIGLMVENEKGSSLFTDELNEALEHIAGLLEQFNNSNLEHEQPSYPQVALLKDNFLSSIKNSMKPGLNLD